METRRTQALVKIQAMPHPNALLRAVVGPVAAEPASVQPGPECGYRATRGIGVLGSFAWCAILASAPSWPSGDESDLTVETYCGENQTWGREQSRDAARADATSFGMGYHAQ